MHTGSVATYFFEATLQSNLQVWSWSMAQASTCKISSSTLAQTSLLLREQRYHSFVRDMELTLSHTCLTIWGYFLEHRYSQYPRDCCSKEGTKKVSNLGKQHAYLQEILGHGPLVSKTCHEWQSALDLEWFKCANTLYTFQRKLLTRRSVIDKSIYTDSQPSA